MKKIPLLLLLVLAGFNSFAVKATAFQDDYTTSVTFPGNFVVGDYREFVQLNPLAAAAAGYYEVSIAYTRTDIAAAATFIVSVSHMNTAVWREAGRVNNNGYLAAGSQNFTVDCNGTYGASKLRVRAINTLGSASIPLTVDIKVRSININGTYTALTGTGNDLTVNTMQPMTNSWVLLTGNGAVNASAKVALFASQNGEVSIGHMTPAAGLHVTTTKTQANGELAAAILGNAFNHWTYFGSASGGKIRGSSEGYIDIETNPTGTDKKIYMNNASSGNILMASGGGNVGIGTNTPEYKLAVNGTIGAKKVKVTLAGWPDYVFEKDYRLSSLQEIRQYINLHKHLPDVPSAAEVEASGLDLGEMNKKLLQKVEELTLYLIEEQQQRKKLEEAVKELQQKVK